MKETAKEVGKKLLEIVRFIFFIPAGFLAGTLVKFPLLLLARIQESMFGLKMDSWGTHLWQTLIIYIGISYNMSITYFNYYFLNITVL